MSKHCYTNYPVGHFVYKCMINVLSSIKSVLKKNLTLLTQLFGTVLLSKKQTELYLQVEAENIYYAAGSDLVLAKVPSLSSTKKQLFKEKYITTAAAAIWKYRNTATKAKQLRNGSIVISNNVLDVGFGNSIVAKDMLNRSSRKLRTTDILIAPWSHYWTGYFDYMLFVALNICRIKEVLPPEEFADAVLSYPLFNNDFERQIIDILGIKKENVVDSRETNIAFGTCLVGNNDSWFYPSRQNVLLFKSLIESKVAFEKEEQSRIYIQRVGRRKVTNEDELLLLLTKYDIKVIEDIPRSFAEQVNIYRNASFIIGPHGASFTNILWCRPGTQLVELFASHYMPEYFRYLAQILELDYAAYCQGQPMGNEHSHVNDDVLVNLDEVEQYLQHLLK